MELTPEEKRRIYEEEKARVEAQEKVKKEKELEAKKAQEKQVKKVGIGCAVIILIIIIIIGIGGIIGSLTPDDKTEEVPSSIVDLKASVVFDGAQFIITNNDNFDWTNVKFEVNSGIFEGGYVLRASKVDAGGTYTVGALQFAKGGGERLNPFTHKVQSISIWCDTPKGNGFWFGEFQ
jgi:ABC-type xylose transport system permease subunit